MDNKQETDAVLNDESLLIEYIDNELPPDKRKEVDIRLQREPQLKAQLEALEKTWKFLDLLDPAEPSSELSAITMQLVAIESNTASRLKIRTVRSAQSDIKNIRKLIYRSALAVIFFCAAFFAGTFIVPNDPDFNNAVRRIDMYLVLADEGFELLEELNEKRLFLPASGISAEISATVNANSSVPIPESRFKKFMDLSSERKNQIRRLHRAVEQSPHRDELVLTLQNYYLWRKSLQSYEKTELRKPCPVEEKVQKIAALKERIDSEPVQSGLLRFGSEAELAKTLTDIPLPEKEELLNNPPETILNKLQQEHGQSRSH